MTVAELMIQEFNYESSNTRKCLERIPQDRFDYKPHQKSFSMLELGTHLANLITWTETIVNHDFFDFGAPSEPAPTPQSPAELLELFDKNLKGFNETLGGKSDELLFKKWQLRDGDNVMLELPKAACIRSFVLNHTVHHRGQLTVYMRENDIPLPPLYGPSADEAI